MHTTDVVFSSAEAIPQPKPASHYLPLDLWSSNVGSQSGLDAALKNIDEFYEAHSSSTHSFGVVDINIFYRYYLVHLLKPSHLIEA